MIGSPRPGPSGLSPTRPQRPGFRVRIRSPARTTGPLAAHNLGPALTATGWHLDTDEDAPPHDFLARAVPRG